MAIATVKSGVRRVLRLVDEPFNEGVTLELSRAEANTLAQVMAVIGGGTRTSARKCTQNIYDALSEAGIKYRYAREQLFDRGADHLYFNDESLKLVERE